MKNPESPNTYYREEDAINAVNANHERATQLRQAEATAEERRLSRAEKIEEIKHKKKIRTAVAAILVSAIAAGSMLWSADVDTFEGNQAKRIENSRILNEYHITEDDISFGKGEMEFSMNGVEYELTSKTGYDKNDVLTSGGIIEGTATRQTPEGEEVHSFETEEDEEGNQKELSIDSAIVRLGFENLPSDSTTE